MAPSRCATKLPCNALPLWPVHLSHSSEDVCDLMQHRIHEVMFVLFHLPDRHREFDDSSAACVTRCASHAVRPLQRDACEVVLGEVLAQLRNRLHRYFVELEDLLVTHRNVSYVPLGQLLSYVSDAVSGLL